VWSSQENNHLGSHKECSLRALAVASVAMVAQCGTDGDVSRPRT
jgi:hypothetical protein